MKMFLWMNLWKNTDNNNWMKMNYNKCMMNSNKKDFWEQRYMPEKLKNSIELLLLLKDSNVSDALYDEIVDWLAACIDMDYLFNMPKHKTQKWKNWEINLYPEQKQCILASIGLPNSFLNSLFSLLVVFDLMRKENLLFADMNSPAYVPPRDLSGKVDSINTGNVYYDYYDKLKNCSNNVITP